jgi:hypothetical protein
METAKGEPSSHGWAALTREEAWRHGRLPAVAGPQPSRTSETNRSFFFVSWIRRTNRKALGAGRDAIRKVGAWETSMAPLR